MIEFLLLDLDNTILDFEKAEHVALPKTFQSFGIEPTQTIMQGYRQINRALWRSFERGEITRQQVLRGRFEQLVHAFSLSAQPEQMANKYEEYLSVGHYFLPGAEEALKRLYSAYKLYLVSNGTAWVQAARLESAGIVPYFQKIFVSEDIGAHKPDQAYFDYCFAHIPGFDRKKAVIVGDSLTSDVLGGIRAGIRTAWVNPGHKTPPPEIRPDYEIAGIYQLEALLEKI